MLHIIKYAAIAGMVLLGGCKAGGCGDNGPVVAPTVIHSDTQEAGDPVLPAYKPWWVQ